MSTSVAAVMAQPDRPAGRGGKVQFGPVKALAVDNPDVSFVIPMHPNPEVRAQWSVLEDMGHPVHVGDAEAAAHGAYAQMHAKDAQRKKRAA